MPIITAIRRKRRKKGRKGERKGKREKGREVIYKSDGFLLWIPNGLNWNHLCMEKH